MPAAMVGLEPTRSFDNRVTTDSATNYDLHGYELKEQYKNKKPLGFPRGLEIVTIPYEFCPPWDRQILWAAAAMATTAFVIILLFVNIVIFPYSLRIIQLPAIKSRIILKFLFRMGSCLETKTFLGT